MAEARQYWLEMIQSKSRSQGLVEDILHRLVVIN